MELADYINPIMMSIGMFLVTKTMFEPNYIPVVLFTAITFVALETIEKAKCGELS